MEFFGKFHPLVLHLPIGFIIGAMFFEWMDWRKKTERFSSTVSILLGLGALFAILSALMGLALSQRGGYDVQLLNVHQWTGIGVAILTTAFYFFRPRLLPQPTMLWGAWAINALLLTIAGHYGGTLTHGKTYLAESAPPFLSGILGGGMEKNASLDVPLDSAVVFEDLIQPIMQKKCWSCHNNGKSKGGLNMEVLKGWERGGQTGPLLVHGKASESLLMQRIFLPMNDKEHMPPEGKPQLLPFEVALLEWWINNNGDFASKVADLETDKRVDPILRAAFGEKDIYDQIDAPFLSASKLVEIQNGGIKILPIAQESPFLEASFSGDTLITDNQLELLLKARKQIVRLDFSRSGIKEDQLKRFDRFSNLLHLELQQTDVGDEGVKSLPSLPYLNYLNLYGTQITDEGLQEVSNIESLRSLYLWQSKATQEGVDALRSRRPDMMVDFGIELDELYQNVTLEAPMIEADSLMFTQPTQVKLKLNFSDVDIRYTLDGTDPDSTSKSYDAPIEVAQTTTIKAIAFKEGWEPSPISQKQLVRIKYAPTTISLNNPPAPKYSGNGPNTLIDRKLGTESFQDGNWLGWEKSHVTATIDLGKVVPITKVTLSALEATGSYIFFPKGVDIEVSKDNQQFKRVKQTNYPTTTKDNPPTLKQFTTSFDTQNVRYVRVAVESNLVNPDWHPAPGAPCWIFIDEIVVE